MLLEPAPDVEKLVDVVIKTRMFPHVDRSRVVCVRSTHATARARARIYAFPRVWQIALNLKPHYVIEVLSHHFDHLKPDEKTRVIIHELMHIPKTFSGALAPHNGRYMRINARTVETLYRTYMKAGIQ